MKTWPGTKSLNALKESAGIVALKGLNNIIPQSQLCGMYYCFIEGHLRYGDIVLG